MSFLSVDNLNVNHKVIIKPPSSGLRFLDAIKRYVRHIANTMPAPYTLFVSGGVDSQVMMYAWLISGIPFKVVNVAYQGLNDHDYIETLHFAGRHGIVIERLEFDIITFLEQDLDRYAIPYECSSPQICAHMAFTELVADGTKILSGNLPIPDQPSMNNTIFGLQRYATMTGANIVPFFLLSDEESASIAAQVAISLPAEEMGHYDFKCLVYRELGIPIIPQSTKMTGFEKLKELYEHQPERVTPEMRLRHSGLLSHGVFDQLFRNKYMIILKNAYQTKFVVQK